MQTLPVVLTMVLASLGALIPATLVVLALSSLTRRTRFATAAWIVLCTFGPITHAVLQQTQALKDSGWTFLLSLPHSIRALQLGLYDVGGRVEELGLHPDTDQVIDGLTSDNSPWRAAAWLATISVLCFLLLLRRVDAPTRI